MASAEKNWRFLFEILWRAFRYPSPFNGFIKRLELDGASGNSQNFFDTLI
jgi:hypothetical protein